jgi:hypothetical protein
VSASADHTSDFQPSMYRPTTVLAPEAAPPQPEASGEGGDERVGGKTARPGGMTRLSLNPNFEIPNPPIPKLCVKGILGEADRVNVSP